MQVKTTIFGSCAADGNHHPRYFRVSETTTGVSTINEIKFGTATVKSHFEITQDDDNKVVLSKAP